MVLLDLVGDPSLPLVSIAPGFVGPVSHDWTLYIPAAGTFITCAEVYAVLAQRKIER